MGIVSREEKMVRVRIKERSWLARVAAYVLKCNSVAMVIGRTIYLHNSGKEEFLNNIEWVRHEVAHVKQYQEMGLLPFLTLYLTETIKKGYQNNRFEVEARQKEKDSSILSGFYFT